MNGQQCPSSHSWDCNPTSVFPFLPLSTYNGPCADNANAQLWTFAEGSISGGDCFEGTTPVVSRHLVFGCRWGLLSRFHSLVRLHR